MAVKKDGYYTWPEIAFVLGCSVSQAQAAYKSAMKKLMEDAKFNQYFYYDNLLY